MAFFRTDAEPAQTPEATARRERFTQLAELVRLGLRQFEKIGRALEEIRDRQLYRDTHATFDDCCQAEWHMTARHAERLIAAAEVCRNLRPTGHTPKSERQARELSTLPAEQQPAAWREALDNGGTTAAVRDAVSKRKPRRVQARRRPIRYRVAGGTVVIEPNKSFTDAESLLLKALEKERAKKLPRAA